MIFSALTILMVLLLAFIWGNRGFYNALIHLACTVVAGAIAFALWETIAYALVDASPARGVLKALEGVAWGIALAAPFAVSLALLRLLMDQILRFNINVTTAVNYTGAAICGLVSATIATGIFALSVSYFRVVPGPFKVDTIASAANGSIVRQEKLWFPVDRIVAGLYSHLSERALASQTPLARWHPDFAEGGYAMRVSYDGKARTTMKPKDFTVVGRVSVGGQGTKLQDLLKDAADSGVQTVQDVNGQPYDPASRIEGIVLDIKSTAGESSGKIVMGNAQIRMIVENATSGERRTLFPIAMSSQAEGDDPVSGRWRFDSKDTFISSVGGGASSAMMFEFVVAPGFEPLAVYVRGVRASLQGARSLGSFMIASERDSVIPTMALALQQGGELKVIASAAGSADLDTSTAEPVSPAQNASLPEGVSTGNAIGFTIQKGLQGSDIEIDEKNNFVTGEKTFTTREIGEMQGIERTLRIGNFLVDPDVQLVKITVSAGSPFTFLNPRVQNSPRTQQIVLIDTNGTRYTPVGLLYKDSTVTKIRYTPSAPLTSLQDIDNYGTMSRSRPESEMTLFFRVSKGVQVRYYAIGNRALVEFLPPMNVD